MSGDRALPMLLRPGLRLAFIGNNPGLESARQGHYYAFRGNVFWRQLSESGLVPRSVTFEDDRGLADLAGIGFTDLCTRATRAASELTREEVAEGAARLLAELLEYAPAVAVFSGRGVFAPFARHALGLSVAALRDRDFGPQEEVVGPTRLWMIPSSSGLASGLHGRRLELLSELTSAVGR